MKIRPSDLDYIYDMNYEELKETLLLMSANRFREFLTIETNESDMQILINKLIELIHLSAKDINRFIKDLDALVG